MPNCLNCNDPWVKGEIYCSNCGQKTQLPSLNLWVLVVDFFQNFFNLESKIWLTLRDIWVPGKITKAYLHGQRVKYYNPIRIFLITLFALFALLISLFNEGIEEVNKFSESQKEQVKDKKLAVKLDSLLTSYEIDSVTIDTTIYGLFGNVNKARIETPDTTIEIAAGAIQFGTSENSNSAVTLTDIYSLSPEKLSEKLEEKSSFQKTIYLQAQKIAIQPSKGITFIISNGTWAIVLTIILLALFYKLLYVRNGYLVVEHFLFHLNGHTRLFLIGIVLCLLTKFFGYFDGYIFLFHSLGFIYLFLAMKFFYNQSFIKTTAKFVLSLIAFMTLASISGMCIIYISFLVF